MKDPIYLWEEPLANPLASQDSAEDWLTHAATSPLDLFNWLRSCVHGGSFGKMCPASCQAEKDGILVPSSGRWLNSGMGGPTESLTLNTGESHSAAAVCFLSDVLEDQPVQARYFLSVKACSGIIRRATSRGKALPVMLRRALEQVAQAPVE